MLAERLEKAIKAVCPIDGVSLGSLTDRATWSFQASANATVAQITAGVAAMAAFDPTPPLEEKIENYANGRVLAILILKGSSFWASIPPAKQQRLQAALDEAAADIRAIINAS